MPDHTSDTPESGPDICRTLAFWRVGDQAFARAYDAAGDRGRAVIKTALAALFEAAHPGRPPSLAMAAGFHSGLMRVEQLTPRPWFLLVIAPDVRSPSQVAAAVMPALSLRIPVFAVRLGARSPWPPAVLAAFELAGVEQVFAPPKEHFTRFLKDLNEQDGGVACLGDRSFWESVRGLFPLKRRVHWLAPPESAGLYHDPNTHWDDEILRFAHAGLRFVEYGPKSQLQGETPWAIFAPAAKAPPSAGLVLEPGCEALWDWPDMPESLFFSRRLIYS